MNHDLRHEARRHAAARTDAYLYNQLIPYIGNKRRLLPLIAEAIARAGVRGSTFVDFFAGSGVVGRLAKTLGFRVIANDWEPYAAEINRCFVACNVLPPFAALGGAEAAFAALNAAAPLEGYVTTHLCPADDACPDPDRERMFFTRRNGMKIDAMRERIAAWERAGHLDEHERACLLAPFAFATSYVSNTSGLFKGFHRGWGGRTETALYRILSDIRLRPPVLHDNGRRNEAHRLDALVLAERLRARREPVALAYLDPPYNQHPYGSNYHVLNTLVLWDKPPVSRCVGRGSKSAIRTDWRTERRSPFNHADTALEAYEALLDAIDARCILTSYSTDGNMPLRPLLRAAARRGALFAVLNPYKRYRVSSQRMSPKPVNVEFVLGIDTTARGDAAAADRVLDEILAVERQALLAHPETAGTLAAR